MNQGRVIGLLGPTGVGKTAVAVDLAKLLGCRIISCDSMQVYAGFPVLTNQPCKDEDRPDLHDLVGFLEPGRTMSAGEYARLAGDLIERSIADCGWALLAGGSGLYMRAALAPLAAPGPGDGELRRQLEERVATAGPEAVYEELRECDPEAAASIDPRNVRRVVRALEGVRGHGRLWSGRGDLWEPVYPRPTLVIGLRCERDLLAARIEDRTARMLKDGAVEEVQLFRAERGGESSRPGLPGICSAIGYREITDHVDGHVTLARTQELMSTATRRYARRQGTWLRRVRDAVMIDVERQDSRDIARRIVDLADAGA